MGKILVIGSTGNIGSALVTLLAKKDEPVVAATRHPESYQGLVGVEKTRFDYDDPASWAPALEGVDRVFAIAKAGDAAPELTLVSFLDAAKSAGVMHAVLVTAAGMENLDEAGLRKVEKYLIGSDMDYTILRPNWFMQNFSTGFLYPMLKGAGTLYLPAGDGKSSFIDTRDIAAVAAAAFTKPGHANREYTLTGGEALSYGEAVEILSRAAGRELRYIPIEPEQFKQSLISNGFSEPNAAFMTGLFDAVRAGYAAAISPAVEQVLGGAPLRLETFARDYAHMWI
jgi:uncharacterized protein YbjT (DUF2867 family)